MTGLVFALALLLQGTPSPLPGVITGQVGGPDGQPAAGARVFVTTSASDAQAAGVQMIPEMLVTLTARPLSKEAAGIRVTGRVTGLPGDPASEEVPGPAAEFPDRRGRRRTARPGWRGNADEDTLLRRNEGHP